MRRLLLLPLVLLSFGCSQNYFNVPKDTYADKVKVLGVAPIFVDADSDIKHPQKDQLVTLISEMNRSNEQFLVGKLKDTGNYYTVTLLPGDPATTFKSLYSRRERRDDAGVVYNKYLWKNDELREYLRKNSLDAVMLIVVSGVSKTEKIFSSNFLASLTSEYNYLTLTAQILDASGTVLWEYPNFRGQLLTYYPLVGLQYPDFSEADANRTNKVAVKFKALEGIRQILDEKRKDYLLRDTRESDVYGKQFDEMLSLLKYDASTEKKALAAPVKPAPAANQPAPVPAQSVIPAAQPAVAAQPAAPAAALPAGVTPVPSDEIVPAADK